MNNKNLMAVCAVVFALFMMLQINVLADYNVLTDDFELGNYNNWIKTTASNGTVSVVSDQNSKVLKLAGSTYFPVAAVNTVNTQVANCSVEADAWIISGKTCPLTISARYKDELNKYSFSYWENADSAEIYIQKTLNGTSTYLVKKTIPLLDRTVVHKFKSVLNGSTLQFYLDGVMEIEALDDAFISGGVSLYSANSGGAVEFDNIVIKEISQNAKVPQVELVKTELNDSSNNVINSGSQVCAGSINTKATLLKRTYTSTNARFITALYNNNDMLLDLSIVPVDFSGGNEVAVNSTVYTPYAAQNCKIKAYVLDNTVSLQPLENIAVSLSFASIPSSEVRSNYFGVSQHIMDSTDYQKELDYIIASGVKWLRIYPRWSSIEKTAKGVYDNTYLAKLDYIVNTCYENNVNIDFILWSVPTWASSNSSNAFYKPTNWSDWEDYVSYITNRYKGKIKTWEVWNEPDLADYWKSSIDDYVTLLQKAYPKVKATDSDNQVVLGGLAWLDGSTTFDTLVSKGADAYFDIINYHAMRYGDYQAAIYGGMNDNVSDKLYTAVMGVVNKYPSQLQSKKIWITECGATSKGLLANEFEKANYIDMIYTLYKRLPNVEKVFYSMYRSYNTPDVNYNNFGLISNDLLTPAKALSTYQAASGASSDFVLQQNFTTKASSLLPLAYVPETGASSPVYENGNMRISNSNNLYFNINDNWLFDSNAGLDTSANVTVTYLDEGTSVWCIQYDGVNGDSTLTENQTLTNSGKWKTKTFALNDIKFANRQINSCDFNIKVINGDLIVKNVMVSKESGRGAIVLGATDRYSLLNRVDSTTTTAEAYNPAETFNGKECRKLIANSNYMYIKVARGLIRTEDKQVEIAITYWDDGTEPIGIQYSSLANNYNLVTVNKTNSKTWKTSVFKISDAKFSRSQVNSCDFRICNPWVPGTNLPEYISKIEVAKL